MLSEEEEMKKRTILVIVLLVNILVMLGCGSGGTSGSVNGSSMNCSSYHCDGGYSKLKGTYTENFERTTGDDDIDVSVSVSVETGAVKFWVVDSKGSQTASNAGPGKPGTITGKAEVSFDEFKVYFESSESEAGGVKFSVDFQ